MATCVGLSFQVDFQAAGPAEAPFAANAAGDVATTATTVTPASATSRRRLGRVGMASMRRFSHENAGWSAGSSTLSSSMGSIVLGVRSAAFRTHPKRCARPARNTGFPSLKPARACLGFSRSIRASTRSTLYSSSRTCSGRASPPSSLKPPLMLRFPAGGCSCMSSAGMKQSRSTRQWASNLPTSRHTKFGPATAMVKRLSRGAS